MTSDLPGSWRIVVGLYLSPPENAIVVCCDEKSQVQAVDRTQPGLPMKKGRCGTMTYYYKRNGTTTVFAALNTLNGSVIETRMPKHRHQEWIRFLNLINRNTPPTKQFTSFATIRDPQACQGRRLAQTQQTLPSSLHANKRLLAQHGRTFPSRYLRAKTSPQGFPLFLETWQQVTEKNDRDFQVSSLNDPPQAVAALSVNSSRLLPITSRPQRHPQAFIADGHHRRCLEKVKRARNKLNSYSVCDGHH